MISLNHFIANTDEPTDDYDGLTRATILGSEIMAVMLHSEMLAEDRVDRTNALWDVLGEREALVVAVFKPSVS